MTGRRVRLWLASLVLALGLRLEFLRVEAQLMYGSQTKNHHPGLAARRMQHAEVRRNSARDRECRNHV